MRRLIGLSLTFGEEHVVVQAVTSEGAEYEVGIEIVACDEPDIILAVRYTGEGPAVLVAPESRSGENRRSSRIMTPWPRSLPRPK